MEKRSGQVVWFTGLSASGKSTLCAAVAAELSELDVRVEVLDGDELRKGLCSDLGFSFEDRVENIRRIAHIAELFNRNGSIVLVATISPFQVCRSTARSILPQMIEVFVDAPLPVCEARDPKCLYKKARAGLLAHFTGIDSPFEPPSMPDITCHTHLETIAQSTSKVMVELISRLERKSGGPSVAPVRRRDRPPTIAVDFDGVIADYDGWKGERLLGAIRGDVLSALIELKAEGWKILIHTTRSADDILAYLVEFQVPFDEINVNSDYTNAGPKPVATVYWDDRALRYSGKALEDLKKIRTFRTWSGRE